MSVTTVPLRPVSKGGLWLMWIGLIALLVAGAAFAGARTHSAERAEVHQRVGREVKQRSLAAAIVDASCAPAR